MFLIHYILYNVYIQEATGSYPTTVTSAYAKGVLQTTVRLGAGTGVTLGGTIYYHLPCELYLEWSIY